MARYRQNEKTFRERKKHVDFVFLTAPHEMPVRRSTLPGPKRRGREVGPQNSYNAMDKTDMCTGYEDSLQAVKEKFLSEGPFDGVMGFSRGAAFVSLLCVLRNDPANRIDFRFAIMIAGFKSLVTPPFGGVWGS